jgi:hypothetical protein
MESKRTCRSESEAKTVQWTVFRTRLASPFEPTNKILSIIKIFPNIKNILKKFFIMCIISKHIEKYIDERFI